MSRKFLFTLAVACGALFTACDNSPTDPDQLRPEFDGRTKTTTTTQAAETPPPAKSSGGAIGDPCDPETYSGPYRCIPDPNNASGYIIAY